MTYQVVFTKGKSRRLRLPLGSTIRSGLTMGIMKVRRLTWAVEELTLAPRRSSSWSHKPTTDKTRKTEVALSAVRYVTLVCLGVKIRTVS